MKKLGVTKEIEKISEGNEAAIKEITEIIIRQTSKKLALIDLYLKNNNWEGLKDVAHFFKSNFLALNLSQFSKLVETLNTEAGLDVETTKKQAQELAAICRQIINELTYKP
jgi:hypothetical protein